MHLGNAHSIAETQEQIMSQWLSEDVSNHGLGSSVIELNLTTGHTLTSKVVEDSDVLAPLGNHRVLEQSQ